MTDTIRKTLQNIGETIEDLKDLADSGGDSENAFNLFVEQAELQVMENKLWQMFSDMEDEIAGLNKDANEVRNYAPGSGRYNDMMFGESPDR